jgi:hypothetical protein
LVTQATNHSKYIGIGEFGTNLQNFGRYIELFYEWCTNHNVIYFVPWNSNGGGYQGQFYDGTYPEVGATWRHMLNPTTFPVRPIPAPFNFTATPGNNQVTFTATPCPSSANVTTYYLYTSSTAGGENLATATQTASTPSFTVAVPNGTTVYAKMAAGNASSVGFVTAEASATAVAPAANTPAYYVAMGATGRVQSSTLPSAVNGPTGDFEAGATFCPLAADLTGSGQLIGVWGKDGYLTSWVFYVNNGYLTLSLHGSNNSNITLTSSVSAGLVANEVYTSYVKYNHAAGTVTFYHGQAGAGTPAQLGAVVTGTAGFALGAASEDPSGDVYPKVTLGSDISGGTQFNGNISAGYFSAGGTVYLNPVAGASSVVDTVSGAPTWALESPAAIGGSGVQPSGNYNLVTSAP